MRLFFIFTLAVLSVIPNYSQTLESEKQSVEITVCQIKLTNPTANFRISYSFIVSTDKDRNVAKIERLGKDEHTFVDIDLLTSCMQDWKLDPNEKALVRFNVGTTSSGSNEKFPNHFAIFQRSGSLRINLPEPSFLTHIKEDKK